MTTKIDILKQDVELAKENVIRAAYETVAGCPRFPTELKRACALLDAALHPVQRVAGHRLLSGGGRTDATSEQHERGGTGH